MKANVKEKKRLMLVVLAVGIAASALVALASYYVNMPAWLIVERIGSDGTAFESSAIVLTNEILANYPDLKEGMNLADEQTPGIALSSVVKTTNSEGNEILRLLDSRRNDGQTSTDFIVTNEEKLYRIAIMFSYNGPGLA